MRNEWAYSQKQRENSKDLINNKSKIINLMKQGDKDEMIKRAINNNDSSDDEKYKSLYKKMKKEFELLSSKYNELKTNNKNHELTSLKIKVENLKSEIFNLKTSIKDKEQQVINVTKLYEEEQNKVKSYKQIMLSLDKEKEALSEGYSIIKDKLEDQQERNKSLQKKISRYHATTYAIHMTEISDLNDQLKIYAKINQNKDLQIKELEIKLLKYEEQNPHFVLNGLIQKVTPENVHLYHQSEVLTRKYNEILKKVFNDNFNESADIQTKTLYGYIKGNDEGYVFVDLDQNQYEINTHVGVLEDGKPMAAFLNQDNTVDAYWYYKSEKIMQYDVENSMSPNKGSSAYQQDILLYFEQLERFNVAIIASVIGSRYKDRLRYHGLNATWIDPVNRPLIHVKNAIRKSDIAILIEDDIPKNVLYALENDGSDKYQFIKNHHNEDIIFDLVKSTALRLGIIK